MCWALAGTFFHSGQGNSRDSSTNDQNPQDPSEPTALRGRACRQEQSTEHGSLDPEHKLVIICKNSIKMWVQARNQEKPGWWRSWQSTNVGLKEAPVFFSLRGKHVFPAAEICQKRLLAALNAGGSAQLRWSRSTNKQAVRIYWHILVPFDCFPPGNFDFAMACLITVMMLCLAGDVWEL